MRDHTPDLPETKYHGSLWYRYTCRTCDEIHARIVAPLDDDLRAPEAAHLIAGILTTTVGMRTAGYLLLRYPEDDAEDLLGIASIAPEGDTLAITALTLDKQASYRLTMGLLDDNTTEAARQLAKVAPLAPRFPDTAEGLRAATLHALNFLGASATTEAPTPVAAPVAMSEAQFDKLWGMAS